MMKLNFHATCAVARYSPYSKSQPWLCPRAAAHQSAYYVAAMVATDAFVITVTFFLFTGVSSGAAEAVAAIFLLVGFLVAAPGAVFRGALPDTAVLFTSLFIAGAFAAAPVALFLALTDPGVPPALLAVLAAGLTFEPADFPVVVAATDVVASRFSGPLVTWAA